MQSRFVVSHFASLPNFNLRPFRRMVAALLALALLALVVLAASPDAHRALHAHADEADHECAVTLFSQGFVPLVAAYFALIFGLCLLSALPLMPDVPARRMPGHLLPPQCGPPTY